MPTKCYKEVAFDNNTSFCRRCQEYAFCFKLAENEAKAHWLADLKVDGNDATIVGMASNLRRYG